MRSYTQFKLQAIISRRAGQTYSEIQETLNITIPRSTLSDWLKHIEFSSQEISLITLHKKERILEGTKKSALLNQAKKIAYIRSTEEHFGYLKELLDNKDIAKLSLVLLYLCEGSKHAN